MKAITVKYLPWTATKPSRVKATIGKTSVTLTCSTTEGDAYDEAARQLASKLKWTLPIVKGETHDGQTVYVPMDDSNVITLDD